MRGQQPHGVDLVHRKGDAQAVDGAVGEARERGVQLTLRVRREDGLGLKDGCGMKVGGVGGVAWWWWCGREVLFMFVSWRE